MNLKGATLIPLVSVDVVVSWAPTPTQLQPFCLSCWNYLGQNTGVGSFSLLQGIFPTQGSNPGLPHCKWILYQLGPQGKPKNTGVGSLSLLQEIFPTQGSNPGLLHCRQILYHLRHQGSPIYVY